MKGSGSAILLPPARTSLDGAVTRGFDAGYFVWALAAPIAMGAARATDAASSMVARIFMAHLHVARIERSLRAAMHYRVGQVVMAHRSAMKARRTATTEDD
jgi:hypothetical protein